MNTLQLRDKIIKQLHQEYSNKKIILPLNQGTSSAVLCKLLSQAINPKNINAYYFITSANDDINPIIKLTTSAGVNLTAVTNIYPQELLQHHASQEKAQILNPQDKTSILLQGKQNKQPTPLKELYRTQILGLAELCSIPQQIINKEQKPNPQLPQTECRLADYSLIDHVLKLHHEQKLTKKQIIQQGISEKEYEKIINKKTKEST